MIDALLEHYAPALARALADMLADDEEEEPEEDDWVREILYEHVPSDLAEQSLAELQQLLA